MDQLENQTSVPDKNLKAGLIVLKGKRVAFHCDKYFYSGVIEDVGNDDILVSDPLVILSSGNLMDEHWEKCIKVPSNLNIRLCSIESYWESDK